MYGGLLKSASALAIVAAAGFYGVSPASAADLGGDCCADLEERVAELEATTVRKGTRKVSVTLSGQISQELLFWDDGIQSDMYVGGPNASNSRWRFLGSAKISPEITAGFLYELQAYASATSSANQLTSGGDDQGGALFGGGANALREAMAWIEHSRLGRISIGHGSNFANNSILVDLSGKGMAASNGVFLHGGTGFFIADSGGSYANATWLQFMQGATGEDWLNTRNEHIQYRTPTIAGFTLGASVGEDNYWDVGIRYAGEFNGVRIAANVAYSVNSEFNTPFTGAGAAFPDQLECFTNCDKEVTQLAGSASIRHMPTGLFFTGAAGWRETDNAVVSGDTISFDSSFYYLSAGIARNYFGLGDTVLYGEFSEWKGVGQSTYGLAAEDTTMQHWGVGIVQHVDAAAMELYVAYKNFSLKDASGAISGLDAEDIHLVTAGTRIRF
jgi:hypothetical protein